MGGKNKKVFEVCVADYLMAQKPQAFFNCTTNVSDWSSRSSAVLPPG